MVALVTLTCRGCGMEFACNTTKSKQFCCADCRFRHLRREHERKSVAVVGAPKKNCLQCGADMPYPCAKYRHHWSKARFCSVKCAAKHNGRTLRGRSWGNRRKANHFYDATPEEIAATCDAIYAETLAALRRPEPVESDEMFRRLRAWERDPSRIAIDWKNK